MVEWQASTKRVESMEQDVVNVIIDDSSKWCASDKNDEIVRGLCCCGG